MKLADRVRLELIGGAGVRIGLRVEELPDLAALRYVARAQGSSKLNCVPTPEPTLLDMASASGQMRPYR